MHGLPTASLLSLFRRNLMPDGSAARSLESDVVGCEYRFRLTSGERDIFRSVPFMSPSEWAEKNYVVMDGPMSGSRYRPSATPYTTGVLNAIMEDSVRMVVCPGSAQTGKTAILHIFLGYSVERLPGPKMLAMDNESNLGKVVENKLLPNFRASPPLRSRLVSSKSTQIKFRNGDVLYLASAASASQRASVSVRVLCMDEEDLYEAREDSAHPVDEFLERKKSFSDPLNDTSKVLRISKPLGVDGESSIENAYKACDEIRHFHARCPVCQHEQIMDRSGLVAVGGETDPSVIRREHLGRYQCRECGNLWSDNYRNYAVRNGRWVAEKPVVKPLSVGARIPDCISPFVSLSEILADDIEAHADGTPSRLTHYYNSHWARTWAPVVSETAAEQVLSCVDRTQAARLVPAGAAFLTAGIDMQRSGYFFTVYAWAVSGEHWLIDYGYLPDFESVKALVFETRYEREGGGDTIIHRAAMDTGGGEAKEGSASMTELAYKNIMGCPSGRLYAVKGAPRTFEKRVLPKVIGKLPSSKMPIAGGFNLYFLDTGYFKELVHASLRVDSGHAMHLHADTGADFADQITAERQVLRKGKLLWEKIRRDNHYLDCAVYARAAASVEWAPSLKGLWVYHQRQEERSAAVERTATAQAVKMNPFTGGRNYFGKRR